MPVANGMPLAAIGAGEEVPAAKLPPLRDFRASYRSLWLDSSEDATYMVALAAVR